MADTTFEMNMAVLDAHQSSLFLLVPLNTAKQLSTRDGTIDEIFPLKIFEYDFTEKITKELSSEMSVVEVPLDST